MKMKINIKEIEFEYVPGKVGTGEFNFHDQLRIKKAFETELARLFLDASNENIFSSDLLKNNHFTLKSHEYTNFTKEIDGGEFSFSTGPTISNVGKNLANSIYSNLI
jgi:hypothetical protein